MKLTGFIASIGAKACADFVGSGAIHREDNARPEFSILANREIAAMVFWCIARPIHLKHRGCDRADGGGRRCRLFCVTKIKNDSPFQTAIYFSLVHPCFKDSVSKPKFLSQFEHIMSRKLKN
jgi:hypothetical protein